MQGMRRGKRWKHLMQNLKFKGFGCCGSSWSFAQLGTGEEMVVGRGEEASGGSIFVCVNHVPATGVTNLASALAAERNNSRGEKMMEKSLMMRMLEEVQGDEDWEEEIGGDDEEGGGGGILCCCVCIERGKDAAFIPCGHTFCRVCSREFWLNRGSCPLCNCTIAEVLKIFGANFLFLGDLSLSLSFNCCR